MRGPAWAIDGFLAAFLLTAQQPDADGSAGQLHLQQLSRVRGWQDEYTDLSERRKLVPEVPVRLRSKLLFFIFPFYYPF